MHKQYFGKRNKMRFDSPEEYYETLGFLAKSDGSSDLYKENNQNQGAWSHEMRINCYKNLNNFRHRLEENSLKDVVKRFYIE